MDGSFSSNRSMHSGHATITLPPITSTRTRNRPGGERRHGCASPGIVFGSNGSGLERAAASCCGPSGSEGVGISLRAKSGRHAGGAERVRSACRGPPPAHELRCHPSHQLRHGSPMHRPQREGVKEFSCEGCPTRLAVHRGQECAPSALGTTCDLSPPEDRLDAGPCAEFAEWWGSGRWGAFQSAETKPR